MTSALAVLYALAAVLLVLMVASATVLVRRVSPTYAALTFLWGGTLVGADVAYAAAVTGQLDAGVGRRWTLVLAILFAAAQVLVSRSLVAQWLELNLDAYMLSVGVVLVGWTIAVIAADPSAPGHADADVVYLCAAALFVGILQRQLRTLVVPNRLAMPLLLAVGVVHLGGVTVLVFGQQELGLPVVLGLVLLIVSYVLMLASAVGLHGVQPESTGLRSSRLASNLPYLVVIIAAPVVLLGLSTGSDLRQPYYVGLCALLAVTLCARQILTANTNERLLVQIADRERLFRSLVQDSSDVTMISTPDGQLEYVSPAARRVLGTPAESLVGASAAAVLALSATELDLATRRVLSTGASERVESRRLDGADVIVLESVLSRRDDRLLINVRDVSERAEMREQLQHMAYHDELTGLPNRHRMHDEITAALELAGSPGGLAEPALLFVDLDRFKSVNDAAGHAAGDAVLRVVADRLRTVVPPAAVLGRVGGDEFVVLLPPSAAGGRELVAHEIARVMAAPCETDHGSFVIGASVGIAAAWGARDADDMLRHADLAMYAAKRDLRPWQAYEPHLHEVAVARAAQDRTYSAILDDNQLSVLFQPVVDITTAQPVGCEALLRWRDPAGRLGEPAGLLDFAARTGRMYDLSIWVLRTALDEAARWRDSGAALRLAVNLSSRDVLHPGLATLVRAELDKRGLAPSALSLEITEQVLLGDPEAATRVCADLRASGVIVAIDDFGTGFSSLKYLVDLPIDVLKIDQSFIHSLHRGGSAAVVVSAVVQMARELGLQVIAEGIETEEQRRLVLAAGVRYGQGYRFAGELTKAQMSDLVTAELRAGRA